MPRRERARRSALRSVDRGLLVADDPADVPETSLELRRAAVAVAAPLASVAGGAMGSILADAEGLDSVDTRFVAVSLGAAVPLFVALVARGDMRRRRALAALGLPWVGALLWPRSSVAASWLSASLLLLGAEAIVHAARCAAALGASTTSRVGLGLLVGLPGLYGWLAAAVVLVNTQLVIVPVRVIHQDPSRGVDERFVTLRTDDGYALEATYTRGTTATGIVLTHGVSDARDRWLPWVERLRERGVHALRFDLRAHGRSEGAVCTYGQREVADVRAAVRWLRARPGVERVAVVGASMGGGVVLAASPDLDVPAIVALAPASDYAVLVRERTALLGPLGGPILSASARIAGAMGQRPMREWIPRARMTSALPVLVFHGTADGTIPIALSRRLAREHANVTLHELAGVEHDEINARVASDAWGVVWPFLERHLREE